MALACFACHSCPSGLAPRPGGRKPSTAPRGAAFRVEHSAPAWHRWPATRLWLAQVSHAGPAPHAGTGTTCPARLQPGACFPRLGPPLQGLPRRACTPSRTGAARSAPPDRSCGNPCPTAATARGSRSRAASAAVRRPRSAENAPPRRSLLCDGPSASASRRMDSRLAAGLPVSSRLPPRQGRRHTPARTLTVGSPLPASGAWAHPGLGPARPRAHYAPLRPGRRQHHGGRAAHWPTPRGPRALDASSGVARAPSAGGRFRCIQPRWTRPALRRLSDSSRRARLRSPPRARTGRTAPCASPRTWGAARTGYALAHRLRRTDSALEAAPHGDTPAGGEPGLPAPSCPGRRTWTPPPAAACAA